MQTHQQAEPQERPLVLNLHQKLKQDALANYEDALGNCEDDLANCDLPWEIDA